MKRKDIENRLLDYVDGRLSESAQSSLEEWIADCEENLRKAEQVSALEQTASKIYAKNHIDVEAALKRNHHRLRVAGRKKRVTNFTRIAACLSLPFMLAAFWLGYLYFAPSGQSMVEIRTTTGMTSCATLPDGSQVWLNSNSTLSYPSKFTSITRNVVLEGQGYFKVAKQNGRKFIVNAGGVKVEVLGTEFDVEAYSDKGDEVRTTLLSGRVKLDYLDAAGERKVQDMVPGESYSYHRSNSRLERLDMNPESASAWKDGKIILDNISLADALRMVENRYNVEFVIQNDELLKNRYCGTFSNQSLDVVLGYFERTTRITFDRNARTTTDSVHLTGRQKIIVE